MPELRFINCIGREVAPPIGIVAGMTLQDVFERHAPQTPVLISRHRAGTVLLPTNETLDPRHDWPALQVGELDIVVITRLPGGPPGAKGGGGGPSGKQIGAAVGLLALTFLAPYALAAIAPGIFTVGSLLTSAVTGGIVLGASYAYGKMTQPTSATPTDDRPLYGVSGGGALARAGDHIPRRFGQIWGPGDLTQPDYFVYDGEDVLLYKRITVSLGDQTILAMRLGTILFWTAEDGVLPPFNAAPGGAGAGQPGLGAGGGGGSSDIGGGTLVEIIPPGGLSTLVPGSVYSNPNVSGIELPRSDDPVPFTVKFPGTPVGETATRYQVDFSLSPINNTNVTPPGGAAYHILILYALIDDDDDVVGPTGQFLNEAAFLNTTRPTRFTRVVDLPEGRYAFWAQNVLVEVEGVSNSISWDGLRAHFPDIITRPHVTEVAIRVRSGPNLGVTAFANVDIQTRAKLRTWNGSSWEVAETRRAVDAWLEVMSGDQGGDLEDAELDLDRVKQLSSLTEFHTFDGIIRGPVSIWDATATVLGPMRAETTRIGAVWSIARDEQRTVQRHNITRRQIVQDSTGSDFKFGREDGSADYIVEYNPDGDQDRRREARVFFGVQSRTPTRIRGMGITEWAHANHYATYRAVAGYFRSETRNVTVDRRGRHFQRGDTALIDSWFMTDDAIAAGVLARDNRTLTLDASPVSLPAYLALRDRLGKVWGPVLVTAGPEANVVVMDAADVAAAEIATGTSLASAFTLDSEEMPSALIGPIETVQEQYIIDSVEIQSTDRVAIKALLDAPEVWTALGEPTPDQPSIPSLGDMVVTTPANIAWLRGQCVQKGLTLVLEWSCAPVRNASAIVVKLSYDDDGDAWEEVFNGLAYDGSYPLRHVEGAIVKLAAWALNLAGIPGQPVYFTFTTTIPQVNSDTADLLVEVENLSNELAAKVQVVDQNIPIAIAQLRKQIRNLAAAAAGHVTALRETHGRSTISLGARYEQNRASIEQVAVAYADADEALAALITELEAVVDGNTAAISEELVVRATADDAIASEITTLTATVGENTAAIDEELIVRADADEAIAGTITTLTATVGENTSAISAEALARADADTAIAGTITSLTTTVGANTAAISSESLARSGGDDALALILTTLFATGPGGSAQTKIRFVTASPPSGAVASVAIEVNVSATATPDYRASGLYIDQMAGFGEIRLVADRVRLQHIDVNSGNPLDMFTIQSIGGSNVAVFNALVYMQRLVAGTINAQDLFVDNVVITGRLVADAVTAPSATTFSNFTVTTVGDFTLGTIVKGIITGRTLMEGHLHILSPAKPWVLYMQFLLNGSRVGEIRKMGTGVTDLNPGGGGQLAASADGTFSIQELFTFGANTTYTFGLRLTVVDSPFGANVTNAGTCIIRQPMLKVTELKR